MEDANPPPKTWRLEILRGLDLVYRLDFPTHRLEDSAVPAFMKALLLRYEPLSDGEAVAALLNRRKGGPLGLSIPKPRQWQDLERSRCGYSVLGPTVSIMLFWTMDERVKQFFRDFNRESSTP